MTIYNTNGTPYQLANSVQQFDPQSQDLDLFNLWAQEAIHLGGSPVFLARQILSGGEIDKTYNEDRSKVWAPWVKLYATYTPIPSSNVLENYGIDSIGDEVIFTMSYKEVLSVLKTAPPLGSIILTPHLSEYWEVIQRNLNQNGFMLWGTTYLDLICRRLQISETSLPVGLSQLPDFKMI